MDDDRDRASEVADALDEIGQERLADMLTDSMSALVDGTVEPTVAPATPPTDERRSWLLGSDLDAADCADTQQAMRTVSETVLELSPRRVARVEFAALTDLVPDGATDAVDALRRCDDVVVSDLECYGTVPAAHCDDVLSLYGDALLTARFEDCDGTTIVSRDDTAQLRFWLPDAASERLGTRLDAAIRDAIRHD
ncbi:hypothetical protein VB773_06035 [Haloarculaceae archaeon H-GB2-1]|nr:hypothetical protein [Haloarculaceae archaeon H-GB1-1]MEA5385677.1 hypothetical protein [Haloarculaceae archaeon H-GB11]MEA5407178.1 hypothetical protein [Haloarculaceae archaeon H-GB2-1]